MYIQQLAACTHQLIYYDKHHVVNHEFHKNHQLYPPVLHRQIIQCYPNHVLGIELDVNNLWWDPWLYKQMRVAANKNLICGVQLSDVSNDGSQERVIMGKGVFNIEDFVCFLNELGYSGMFEVELIGKSLWMRDSHQYMKEIIKSCAHLLG